MQRQWWWIGGVGIILIVVSSAGYDPLVWLVPGISPRLLPGLCLLTLIGGLALRLQTVGTSLARVLGQQKEIQTQLPVMLQRLDETTTQLAHVTAAVTALQQRMTQNAWLIPGKMLVLQHRYDDAI